MPKLLLVDDNEINRDMLSRRLQLKGYEVIFAADGVEGVSKTLTQQPDLVLMDISLPVMDGWEAIRQIKANPETQNIAVIALTAHAMPNDREKALATGCDEYETKPVNFPRLLSKIEQHLHKEKTQQHSEPSIPQDKQTQRALLSYLRYELCTPINAIICYSEILLDQLKSQRDSQWLGDLQKIHAVSTQLLAIFSFILNPGQVELSQNNWNINTLTSTIRQETLTPLSTVIGYCEMLQEEANNALPLADLEAIHTAAKHLLNMVNDIVNIAAQQLGIIDAHPSIATTLPQDTPPYVMTQTGSLLVVDNNETNRDLLVRLLESQGYTVVTAMNGEQALQKLQAKSYDLILLDIAMPGIDGFKVLEKIKTDPHWQKIPVIVICNSDINQLDTVVRCIQIGAEDYLFVPFKPVLLHRKISAWLEKKRLQNLEVELKQQLELGIEKQVEHRPQEAEITQNKYDQLLEAAEIAVQQDEPEERILKILLVEDNEMNRDMLARRLQQLGYEVAIAVDGAEALSKVATEKPDIVLMDMSLPVMDGWQATRQIKANPETKDIQVIALTAHAMSGDREKALAAGCDEYDTKPIKMPRLLGKIKTLMEKAKC